MREKNLLLGDMMKEGILFAISDLSIRFILPARLDDLLTITTGIKKIKTCSFIFEQKIENQDKKLICEATVQVVCLTDNLRPKVTPQAIKNLVLEA